MPARIDKSIIPVTPDLSLESSFWINHVQYVAGLDEAGRGAWAGPVVAGAVILPCDRSGEQALHEVRDSKQLSSKKREELSLLIKQHALTWGIGSSDNQEIDQIGILPATRLAMMRAIEALTVPPEHLLLDALILPDSPIAQTALIKGDQRSLSIASASILAKTTRDAWMIHAHSEYPFYHFDQHKGYGTKLHQKSLAEFGKCDLHRMTYKPIKDLGR